MEQGLSWRALGNRRVGPGKDGQEVKDLLPIFSEGRTPVRLPASMHNFRYTSFLVLFNQTARISVRSSAASRAIQIAFPPKGAGSTKIASAFLRIPRLMVLTVLLQDVCGR